MINTIMVKNKYHDCYFRIISQAKSSPRKKGNGVHYENHHIIPKALGGSDDKDNLVLLTAKEHLVCHHLLVKFTIGADKSKMNYAFWALINEWGRKKGSRKITARVYSKLKEQIAKQISLNNSGKISPPMSTDKRRKMSIRMSGEKNPQYGKSGKNSPQYGKKRPGIGGRKKGTKWSNEERDQHMKIRSSPGFYEYLKDPERCKKISDSQKGRTGTSTGKIWCNDGRQEFQVNEILPGFKKGRLINNSSKKGLRWFNNGIENRQFREGTQPPEFVNGRIFKK